MALDWKEVCETILSRLNLVEEFTALGLRIPPSSKPNSRGWLPCRAMGREDVHPSAAINVGDGPARGHYKDLGDIGESLSFWDFAVKYGPYADFKHTVNHFGKQTGYSLKRLPKSIRDRPEDVFRFSTTEPRRGVFHPLVKKYGITFESLVLAGVRFASYPANSSEPQSVGVFPAYGPQLTDLPPVGYVAISTLGDPIRLYKGPDAPPEPIGKMSRGESGLLNRHALAILADEKKAAAVEIVWKTEGLSDMLALMSIVPADLRDAHIVTTNSCGATEVDLPKRVAEVFAGHTVYVIHDADVAGEAGAELWQGVLANGIAKEFRNPKLPYDIAAKKGKDLRDWLAEGHGYDDLLELAKAAEVVKPGTSVEGNGKLHGLTQHEALLKHLGVIVLGHIENSNTIVAFSEITSRTFEIRDIDKYGRHTAILNMSDEITDLIHTGGDDAPTGRFTIQQIRDAFAAEGSKRRLNDTNQLGIGIWELNGRILIVGAGELLIWNGRLTQSRKPEVDGKLIDFGGAEPWFDREELESLLNAAAPEWCNATFEEAADLFHRWDNWRYPDMPELIASLVVCTWIQTVWDYRPLIAVTGPSNSGKSMLLEDALQWLFGSLCQFMTKATEAGLRQKIRHTAKVIIIDEFEHDSHRQKIMELFRTSSRGSTDAVVRGTANQRGANFGLRHIPWVGAVETGMRRAADRNRYIMVELEAVPEGRGSKLTLPPRENLQTLGIKLLTVALHHWRQAKAWSAKLKTLAVIGVDRRIAESYSVPVGMIAAIKGLGEPETERLFRSVLESREFFGQQEKDEEDLLKEIFSSNVPVAPGQFSTVSELLFANSYDIRGEMTPDKALQRVGIKRVAGRAGNCDRLFLVCKTISRKLLKDSEDWKSSNIEQILGRVKGAKMGDIQRFPHRTRGLSIPFDSIESLVDSTSEHQNEQQDGVF